LFYNKLWHSLAPQVGGRYNDTIRCITQAFWRMISPTVAGPGHELPDRWRDFEGAALSRLRSGGRAREATTQRHGRGSRQRAPTKRLPHACGGHDEDQLQAEGIAGGAARRR